MNPWGFIGHNFGDYKNSCSSISQWRGVLSVTILETTKTVYPREIFSLQFYRSQFWRLQKPLALPLCDGHCFIGHNFGDYKNIISSSFRFESVLSVTILETTKTRKIQTNYRSLFYRSQFWRLQKPQIVSANYTIKVRIYSA